MSNYHDDYDPYFNDNGKVEITKIPSEVQQDIINDKKALVIFYNHIEDCRAELGTSEIVAALMYALYDYDISLDKDNYEMPTFKDYDKEQAAAARMIFRNMATAAKENMTKWITRKVQNRYNGSKPKTQPQNTPSRYVGFMKDIPGCS